MFHTLVRTTVGPYIFFAVITLLIVFPIFREGYLFLFDWGVSSGEINIWNHSFAHMLVIFLGNIIGYPLFPKILLTLIIYATCLSGYYFSQQLQKNVNEFSYKSISVMSGIFFLFNPFVYTRLLEGQWYVMISLIGSAVLITVLLRWMDSRNSFLIAVAIFISSVTILISQHAAFYILLIVLVFGAFNKVYRDKKALIGFFAIMAVPIFLSGNVIYGYIAGVSENSNLLFQVDHVHFDSFRTVGHGYASVYTNALSFHGYWGEREKRFFSTQEHVYIWKPIFFIFFTLMILGIFALRKKRSVQILAVIGVVSLILGVGAQGVFGFITRALYEHIPFYDGFREPQKWIGIYLIAFVGVFLLSVAYMYNKMHLSAHRNILLVFLLTLIFLYTPNMLWGFSSQIYPQSLPESWRDVKNIVNCENSNEKAVFLPWQQYMKVYFLDQKKIANPASGYFGHCVLTSTNHEISADELHDAGDMNNLVNHLSQAQNDSCPDISMIMKRGDISRVILSREGFEKFKTIRNLKCFSLEYEDELIGVYKLSM